MPPSAWSSRGPRARSSRYSHAASSAHISPSPCLSSFSSRWSSDQRSLATIFGDDRFGNLLGNLIVSIELHAVGRPALRAGTKVRRVAEHFHERHGGLDGLRSSPYLHALNLAPAAIQVADDVAHKLLWNEHLDLHDGFQ